MTSSAPRSTIPLLICVSAAACASSRGSDDELECAKRAQLAPTGEPTLHYLATEVLWTSDREDHQGVEYDVFELCNDTPRTWTYVSHGADSVPGFVSVLRGSEWQPCLENWMRCGYGTREWTLAPGDRRLIGLTSAGRRSIAEVWLCAQYGAMSFTVASEPYEPPERVIRGVSNRARELWTAPRAEYSEARARADRCRARGTRD